MNAIAKLTGPQFASIRKAHSEGRTQESFAKFLNSQLDRRYDGSQISRFERGADPVPKLLAMYLTGPQFNRSPPIRRRIMATVAFANWKGGVGKTTSAVNVAHLLGASGYRVLLVDADAQANATMHVGCNYYAAEAAANTLFHVLLRGTPIERAIQQVEGGAFSILPASTTLSAADGELLGDAFGAMVLKEKIGRLSGSFDFVLLDCPPNLGMATINALNTATSVLIPVQTEPFAAAGVPMMLNTIEKVRTRANPELEILGILPTRFKKRNSVDLATLRDLTAIYEAGETRALSSAPGSSPIKASQLLRVFSPVPESTQYPQGTAAQVPTLAASQEAPGANAYADVAEAIVGLLGVENS